MPDTSYRTLMREDGFRYLLLLSAGVWLFAADRLMEATLLPGIVAEIGGANLIGWGRTLFEAATIMTGMLAAFLVRRWGVRYSFSVCAAGFAAGCVVSAYAPDMLVFQVGRFFQALAGSAFVALASIGVTRMFPHILIARAGSIIAIVWGVAAFSGPLVGGLFDEFSTWRMAFVYLSIFGAVLTLVAFVFLGRHAALTEPVKSGKSEAFPALRMAVLFAGVMSIASGGISFSSVMTPTLVVGGLVLLGGFLWLDQRAGARRLLPERALNLRTKVGAASYMILFLGSAVIGISTFGPILLVNIYGLAPILIGFMMFSVSLGWTIAEVIFSGTPPEREGRVIVAGAFTVVMGVVAFNAAFYTDQVWMIALGFLFQGLGFGTSWALVTRRAIADSEQLEKDRIASSIHTLQRVGFALGAAVLGIVTTRVGFSAEMDAGTARNVAYWVVGLSLPLSVLGLGAAFLFVQERFDMKGPPARTGKSSS